MLVNALPLIKKHGLINNDFIALMHFLHRICTEYAHGAIQFDQRSIFY